MAFNTAITGIKASQVELDVTGNNIANASTVGFKASRTEFADIFTTVVVGAGSTNNPGAGVLVSDIAQDFTAGTIEFTNNNLDLAIDGTGFFVLSDSQGNTTYTRAGGFTLDKDGNVVSKSGKFLQGYGLDDKGNRLPVGNLAVTEKESPPQGTRSAALSFNIDSREDPQGLLRPYDPNNAQTYTFSNSSAIFDSLGNQHTLKIDVVEQPPVFERQTITFADNTSGNAVTLNIAGASVPVGGADTAADILATLTGNTPASLPAAAGSPLDQILAVDDRIKDVSISGNSLVIDFYAGYADVNDIAITSSNNADYAPPGVSSEEVAANEKHYIDILAPTADATVNIGGVDIAINYSAGVDTVSEVISQILQNESDIIANNPEIETIDRDGTNPNRLVITYRSDLEASELATLSPITFNDPGAGIFDDGTGSPVSGSGSATVLQSGDASFQGVYQMHAWLDGTERLDIGKLQDPTVGIASDDLQTEPGPILLKFDTSSGALSSVVFGKDSEEFVTIEGRAPIISILGADPAIPIDDRRREDSAGGEPANDLELDLSGTTQFASESIVKAFTQDGYTKGDLIGVTFASDGTMVASFSNGQNANLGVVALATFENQGGLQPTGNTEWSATLESGQAILNPPGAGLNGLLRSAALEQSNVDLSEELVALIEAQRNYQANSKTLQTANAVTQAILQIS